MATHCPKCGAEVHSEWTTCHSCFEPIQRQGLFARLAKIFSGVRVTTSFTPHINIKVTEQIKIHDPKTGEMREYHSLDEVPPEYREKISQAFQSARSGTSRQMIAVTDASGQVHTYKSI